VAKHRGNRVLDGPCPRARRDVHREQYRRDPEYVARGALYTFQTEPADRGGADGNDPIPGFTGVVGLAGGAVALEWLRRRGNVQD